MPRIGSPLVSWDSSHPGFDPANNRLLTPSISPHREHQSHSLHPQHVQQKVNPQPPQAYGQPSTHTGFLETDSEGNDSVEDSASGGGGYSPPAWRRLENGDRSSGFWRKSDNILGSPTLTTPMRETDDQLHYQHQKQQQQQQQNSLPHPSTSPRAFTSHLQQHFQRRKESRLGRTFASSRASSPGFDSEEDAMVDDMLGPDDDDIFDDHGGSYADDTVLERAMRTRLPGSMSPDKERSPEPELVYPSPLSRMDGMRLKAMESIQEERIGLEFLNGQHETSDNYIRFAVRSEVKHHTKLLHTAVGYVRSRIYFATRSWAHILLSVVVGILSIAAMRALSYAAGFRAVPDLVKVARVARSFEPLIYYSENGVAQVHDLEATGVAVWDLGESVRLSNLTSAPIIVQELDELSDTLRALAMELTRFFSNIDGDIDGILIVMEWARRELGRLQEPPTSTSPSLFLMKPLAAAYDNVYNLLACAGLFENVATGSPTAVGAVATTLFGMSGPQRTRATLHRTFHEFLSVLEEAVATELQHSLALFALFENIDRQFLNLVRTVAREASVQDERHADLLAGLWTRILGPSAAATAKYEQNRELLRDVREKTVRNKGVLVEHNHRLLALKTSLESLRRKLVSPLVRSVNSSTLTLDEQIRGLEDVGAYLSEVRARQKGRLLEALYGVGSVRERIGWSGSSEDDVS
ncbi:hypothetical protein SPBR_05703 [Sporothrix brasiliensis 5110]|uniref:Uncharacterized protein n=1 Tax=Sporothrix brasiliensis 5110 TaxID=1398154 RepID=A0A0C2F5N4_9PEZI|nr:uncharacterized protein SPBR_05703 [Sporothrix brasiliensis 5110]KIH94199.1 hypothetical protein SPBR_05703 [Sporothrix brasiliensis 5110]